MKKRFFINASVLVIGSALLAVIISLVYFLVSLNIDEGHSLLLLLGYLTDFFNAISMFIGFATIIYAFFKFDFYDGVMASLIFAAAFIPYFIYQSITWNIYAEQGYDIVIEGTQAFSSALLGTYYSMGQGVVNQILPSILIAFIACKVIKANKDEPTKFISWQNRFQRSLMISCFALAGINLILFFLTGMLPELIDLDFVMTPSYFSDFIGYVLLSVLDIVVVYILIAYIVFMLTYKFYNSRLKEQK